MTCEHGFIGACAECDGSGQSTEEHDENEARECYCGRIMSEREMKEQRICNDCQST